MTSLAQTPKLRQRRELTANWNDTYLQDPKGGRYRYNETYAVDDVHNGELSSCHVEILEQFWWAFINVHSP
ncbi:MAG: hypothetical protein AAF152_10480 [Cyanobacteria bacterium P01_A01_bin.114]